MALGLAPGVCVDVEQVDRGAERVRRQLLAVPVAVGIDQARGEVRGDVPTHVANDARLLVVELRVLCDLVDGVPRLAGEDRRRAAVARDEGSERRELGVARRLGVHRQGIEAVAVDLRAIEAYRPRRLRRDVPSQRDAPDRLLARAVGLAVEGVVENAVGRRALRSEAHGELLVERHVADDRAVESFEAAAFDLALELLFARRRVRVERDRAQRGVAPEERSLRAAQHFHALHVEERAQDRAGAGNEGAVEIGGDIGIDCGVRRRSEAADPDGDA